MIADAYKGAALRAMLDIVGTPYGAWLDDELAVVAYTGVAIDPDAFEPDGTTCVNTEEVDGGVAPATPASIEYFAIVDAPEGDVVMAGPVTLPEGVAEGDPLVAAPEAIVLAFAEE